MLETYITQSDDVEMEDAPISNRSNSEIEVDNTKPKKAFKESENKYSHSRESSDNFKTPKALKKALAKRAELLAAESDSDFIHMLKTDPNGHRTDVESEDAHESESSVQT